MSPSRSSVPQPAVRIITSYDTDVAGAADALLATLRREPRPDAPTHESKPHELPGDEMTAEDAAVA